MATSRHSPQWLLLSGGLCAKVQPHGQQRGTHITHVSSPSTPDCGHPLGTKGLQSSTEPLPCWSRGDASPHGALGDHTAARSPCRPADAIWLASPQPQQHSRGTGSSQEDGGGGHMSCCWAGAGLPPSLLPPDRPKETCCREMCPPASVTGAKEAW